MVWRQEELQNVLNIRLDKTVRSGRVLRKNCNLNCIWCHGDLFLRNQSSRALDNVHLVFLCRQIIAAAGKEARIRIAGDGEPTLTGEELIDLVQRLRAQSKIRDICITTNGTLLNDMASSLRKAGLDSVTISLNSLDQGKYSEITGKDYLFGVLKGLDNAVSVGLKVKVNALYTKYCESEVEEFIKLSRDYGIVVKFFDLIDPEGLFKDKHLPMGKLKAMLEERAEEAMPYDYPYSGTVYRVKGAIIDAKDSRAKNHCPILTCPRRGQCTEGCRRYVRLGIDGIMQPCGVRKDNLLDLKVNCDRNEIRESLRSGGKL